MSRGIEAKRTHDLVALAKMLLEVVGVTPFTLEEVRQLNPFAVEYRYEDELGSGLSPDELVELVERVMDWADSCVTSTAPPRA